MSGPATYQGECRVCGWTGTPTEDAVAAEHEAAEHAGYCAANRLKTTDNDDR